MSAQLTQEAIDALLARVNPYSYTLDHGLRLTINPDGRKVYTVVVASRPRKVKIEIGPHRALIKNLLDLPPEGVNLSTSHTLAEAQRMAELCGLLYLPAVRIYTKHHGNSERADAFAHQVIERATAYDAVRAWNKHRMSEAQRRQYRTDLDAATATARKLRGLLDRTSIACNFDMADGRRIGYPEILDFMQRQVDAARDALTENKNTGNPRHDIDVLSGRLDMAADLYGIPRDCMTPLLNALVDDASEKTVTKRRK
jgi:hypothetical protein